MFVYKNGVNEKIFKIFRVPAQCHFGHRLKNNKLDLWMIRNSNVGNFFFQLTQKFERNIFYDMATSKILASFLYF